MGRRGEAARVFSEMGHPALAAIELEAAGAAAAARLEWERVLRDERLAGRPYETALAHLSLGEALVRIGDRAGGLRELGTAARLLEVVADEYETGGDTERAFDCYRVLLQLGKDMGSFETVAEGYLNMIRIMATLDQERTLQYYDDFIAYAVENKEHYAAAMAAREVAEYSLRMALVYDRHYLERAAELWVETAHANQLANGPVDLAANAFQAAIDAATALGDLALAGRIYGELAELALPDARRRRYRALARRYESEQPRRLPAPAFPAALRKKDSYKDIWRDDLIEWELDGDPIAVLARLIAENSDTTVFTRPALRALLKFADPNFSMTNPLVVTDAAEAVGKVPAHEVLRALKRLFEHSASEVRAAVVRGAEEGLTPRVFDLVRKALGDPAPAVVDAALQLLRKTNFVGALVAADPDIPRIERRARAARRARRNRHQLGSRWGRRASCSKWRARRRAPSGKPRRRSWRGWPSRGAKRSSRCSVRRATRRRASRARRSSACSRPRPAPERERREQADHDQAQGHEAAPVEHAAAARPQHQHQDGRAGHDPAQVALRRLDARDLLAAYPLQLFRHPFDVDRLAPLLPLDLLLQVGLTVRFVGGTPRRSRTLAAAAAVDWVSLGHTNAI